MELESTGKCLGFFSGHSAQMTQIAFISDEHDHNIRVCMVTELLNNGIAITGIAITGIAITGIAITGIAITGIAITGIAIIV